MTERTQRLSRTTQRGSLLRDLEAGVQGDKSAPRPRVYDNSSIGRGTEAGRDRRTLAKLGRAGTADKPR